MVLSHHFVKEYRLGQYLNLLQIDSKVSVEFVHISYRTSLQMQVLIRVFRGRLGMLCGIILDLKELHDEQKVYEL